MPGRISSTTRHTSDLDHLPDDDHLPVGEHPPPVDGDPDRGTRFSAQLRDHFLQRTPESLAALDGHDQIPRQQPGPIGGRALDRGDHHRRLVHDANRDPQASEAPCGILAKLAKPLLVEVLGIGIQLAKHSLDGRAHHGIVIDRIVVVLDDPAVHRPEPIPAVVDRLVRIIPLSMCGIDIANQRAKCGYKRATDPGGPPARVLRHRRPCHRYGKRGKRSARCLSMEAATSSTSGLPSTSRLRSGSRLAS